MYDFTKGCDLVQYCRSLLWRLTCQCLPLPAIACHCLPLPAIANYLLLPSTASTALRIICNEVVMLLTSADKRIEQTDIESRVLVIRL